MPRSTRRPSFSTAAALGGTLLAGALLAGCEPTATPTAPTDAPPQPSLLRTTQHFRSQEPFELTAVPSCTGEEITITGTIYHTVNLVSGPELPPGAQFHISDHQVIHAMGTSTSGRQYVFTDVRLFSFNTASLPAPIATETFKEIAVSVSQGPPDNRVFVFETHTIYDIDGVKTTIDHFRDVCTG